MIRSPVFLALLTLVTLAVISGIRGEFPINDDWQYAHVARHFAESGIFKVDVAVAPTLWIQSALGALTIRGFGFSHFHLRLLTFILSCGVVALLDRILVLNQVNRGIRILVALTLVTQPIFFHLSTTFMTEHYGLFFGLLGVVCWFSGLQKTGAIIMGASFWVRQFSVLVFPAILLAEFFQEKVSVPALILFIRKHLKSILAFTLPVFVYFPWARWTGNYNPAFSGPFKDMLIPAPGFWITQAPIAIFYFTLFSFPLLILEWASAKPKWGMRSWVKRVSALWGILAIAAGVMAVTARTEYRVEDKIHRFFPFLGNILTPYGIGPITLTDVYWGPNPLQPKVHEEFWMIVEVILLFLASGWILRWERRQSESRQSKTCGSVISDFGLIFTILTFFTAVQAYHYAIFDRYYEPALMGCLIWLSGGSVNQVNFKRSLKAVLALVLFLVASLSVGATHDLFAWNQARWTLFQRAVSRGVPITDIDGGYEINGWFAFEEGRPNSQSRGCGLVQPWHCGNRSYKIVMDSSSGVRVLDAESVHSWIGHYPDLKLIQVSK